MIRPGSCTAKPWLRLLLTFLRAYPLIWQMGTRIPAARRVKWHDLPKEFKAHSRQLIP